ncbi:histidine phosphatase superfamily [Amylocarpus encephaloides]|uniref:Histidine phosphatase superfamily n=1 Tax=Amylocarpus encephaloides TaxID=45428 RepID=A0A9P7YC24_9HELO|nr:histidine phosphatase superfamily [Amylocarpus encephaloides]
MAPTVILIRHAEALHNYTTPDPPLTENGLDIECSELSQYLLNHVPLSHHVELIVTSPLQRTLQTTQHALDFLIKRGIKVIPLAEVQETTTNAIDKGSPLPSLKERWPDYDWSELDPIFPEKEGIYEFSERALLERGAWARKWLASRPEKVIAVVSHAGFMRIGLGNCRYGNADYRIFDLDDRSDSVDKGPVFVEKESTRSSGGGRGKARTGSLAGSCMISSTCLAIRGKRQRN